MTPVLSVRLAALPRSDKILFKAMVATALVALILGIVQGTAVALARAGFLSFFPDMAYRLLTLHGVTVFFYWLYVAQAAFLLIFAAIQGSGSWRLAGRPAGWIGFALMVAGFALSEWAALVGPPMLYDGAPDLAGDGRAMAGALYGGYLLLGAGLFSIAVSGIVTVIGRRDGSGALSAVGFALFAWAGFLMVSAIAAAHAFLPGLLWAFGLGGFPVEHATGWHILFHNLHYLPLMATVLVWYVLVDALTGVTSIFGARFSKIVFSTYLVFVPPTSLYHMFLEPNLSESVRVVGSLLSLFVSVPTVTAFLIIVSSLEAHARAQGGRGVFGWLRHLPWKNPAMTAIAAAMVNLGLGLTFAFVLIQEKLAPLLSDTFFVPGYFHFFTVGTITLTFLAALALVLPGLTGRALGGVALLRRLPMVTTLGLLVFGIAGIAAGLTGVPRRAFDIAYGGAAPALWPWLMAAVGIGGTIMAAALLVYALGLVRLLLPGGTPELVTGPPARDWSNVAAAAAGRAAWVGPLSVVILVGAMVVVSALAFELMHSLPVLATGGAGGH